MGESRKWSFAEIKAWLEEENAEIQRIKETPVPNHWPVGLEVDAAKPPAWLPSDWGAALKASSGTRNKVFVSPEGKLCYNKQAVEKAVGRTLYDEKKKPEKESPPTRNWPDWLPLDWTICLKLSSGKQRVYYVSPSGKGFFNRAQAESYMTNNPDAASSRQKAETGKKGKAKDEVASPHDTKGGGFSPKKNTAEAAMETAPQTDSANKSPATAGASQAGASQAYSAKRPRPDDDGTDVEVDQIGEGEPGEGYALRPCRGGAAWLLLPDDVLELDLEAIGRQLEGSGWSCATRAEHRRSFSGAPELVLYANGKLLVRSGKREDAVRIAKKYVESWLTLE